MSEWISVEERLPEPDGDSVLVWLAHPQWALEPYAMVDQWITLHEDPTGMGGPSIETGCGWAENDDFATVTHWMPLPSPPPTALSEADKEMR